MKCFLLVHSTIYLVLTYCNKSLTPPSCANQHKPSNSKFSVTSPETKSRDRNVLSHVTFPLRAQIPLKIQ